MRILLSSFAACLLLVIVCYGASISSTFDRLEDTLIDLKDELHMLAEDNGKSTHKVKKESTNEKRQFTVPIETPVNNYEYQCGFDGDCTNDFTTTADNAAMAWNRKIEHRGVIYDRKRTGGGFMVADLNRIKDKKEYSRLTTGEFTFAQSEQCASFYYFLYGHEYQADIARLLATMECEGETEPTELFRTSGSNPTDRKWKPVRVTIKKTPGTKCKVTWRVSRGLAYTHSYAAIDDVSMKLGQCPPEGGPQEPEMVDCSFDSINSCGWKISGSAPFAYSGWGTRQRDTGPDSYFGYRSYPSGTRGHYIYLDSRSSSSIGRSKTLRSPIVRSIGPKCMRFALSMYGKNMGSTAVSLIKGDQEQEVFSKEGHQPGKHYKWFDNAIDLPANVDYQVKMKLTIGNGTKSDIAVDNILIQDGACSTDKTLASCAFDSEAACAYSNDICVSTDLVKEYKKDATFKPSRNTKLTTIAKIAKEWSVSVDIKPLKKRGGWSNLFHFTTDGNCCGYGQRTPAIWFFSNSYKLHITNAISGNGNYGYNDITLPENQFSTLKIEQKKGTDGNYYLHISLNGAEKKKVHNTQPREFKDVKVYGSDPWHNEAYVEMKNFLFTNGELEPCNPVCNKHVSDPGFVRAAPKKLTFNAERDVTKNTLLATLPSLEKEWRVSLDVKMTAKTGGWTNIIHATYKNNCCGWGERIPSIFVFSNSYKLHVTSQVDWNGNYAYNNIDLKQNEFSNIAVQQKKVNGEYKYQVYQDGALKLDKEQIRPMSYKNVKYYLSDNYYNAAKAKVKNIQIENLVSEYPCPGMCKGRKGEEDVNGTKVTTFTYDTETCENLPVQAQVNVPSNLRYGCIHMMFKLPKVSGNRCYIQLMNGQRRLHHFRQIKDGWNKVKYDLFENYSKVGLTVNQINSHCPQITVSDITVTEGFC